MKQGGGGVLTLENTEQVIFDSLVYGEREAKKWMAGSENFSRSKNLDAPPEDAKSSDTIHVAAVYSADNRIAFYRNGIHYGTEYTPGSPLRTYPANSARVLIGFRHTGAGNGQFRGDVDEARVYDRALTAEQIVESFKAGQQGIRPEELRAGTDRCTAARVGRTQA